MEACGHTPIWSGQRVERTNVRGRHTYCEPFKAWIIEQARQPGTSLAGLAMSNQVNANQLRRWVQLHGNRAGGSAVPAARLLPVSVVGQAAPTAAAPGKAGSAVEIELAGAVVRVRDGVAPATLRTVLDVLRGRLP
jgi:transposase-like protein